MAWNVVGWSLCMLLIRSFVGPCSIRKRNTVSRVWLSKISTERRVALPWVSSIGI